MKQIGIQLNKVRAGYANMFLSDVFAEAFANTLGANARLYDTDGATGAARGAGVGAGIYNNFGECLLGMKKIKTIEPDKEKQERYAEIYNNWVNQLDNAASAKSPPQEGWSASVCEVTQNSLYDCGRGGF